MKKRFLSTLLLIALFSSLSMATHNRAGEITFIQDGQLTFTVQIHTYTKASSAAADRDSLLINWGDGSTEFISRNTEVLLPNDNKYNVYTAVHTYASIGEYMLSVTDPNRNGGILNVNPPSSDIVPFHIETELKILDTQVNGTNHSPVLLQLPIDRAFTGLPFVHTPNAFDPDGDSLAYELITPLQATALSVPNYLFPDEVEPGSNNQISLNAITGELRWESPRRAGEYNIAFRVKEYRNGNLIGSVIRDMQILVSFIFDIPPTMDYTAPPATIVKGDIVEFEVSSTTGSRSLKLSATGGPFEVSQPATFDAPSDFVDDFVSGTFRWETNDSHVRKQPWQVVFKTESAMGLFVMETVRFSIAESTGILTPVPLARIQVYPNPASQEIQVTWSINEQQNDPLIAQLHSTDGRLLFKTTLDQADGQELIQLPDLPGGLYHFSLNQAGLVLSTQTIVIQ